MIAKIELNGKIHNVDLNLPIDLSIPMQSGTKNPNAFFINEPIFEPIKAGDFIGCVALGGAANCENLFINAHGNGTHTECVGHISKERITINACLKTFFFYAQLISVEPTLLDNGDEIILQESVLNKIENSVEALVLRTLPNHTDKLTKKYSGNNPCYLHPDLCTALVQKNIKHLIIDLPSVDKEEDGGKMLAHKAFWQYPQHPIMDATITELAFIANQIKDGFYLLNLQITGLETDASPSKPILYALN